MSGRTADVDTSAFSKLIVAAPESVALRTRLRRWPAELRSSETIHLAAARSIGPELGGLVTDDARLREAALAQGLDVESPS